VSEPYRSLTGTLLNAEGLARRSVQRLHVVAWSPVQMHALLLDSLEKVVTFAVVPARAWRKKLIRRARRRSA
jgi:hypothetical protein